MDLGLLLLQVVPSILGSPSFDVDVYIMYIMSLRREDSEIERDMSLQ